MSRVWEREAFPNFIFLTAEPTRTSLYIDSVYLKTTLPWGTILTNEHSSDNDDGYMGMGFNLRFRPQPTVPQEFASVEFIEFRLPK